jgi:hypothetical protein
MSIPAGADIVPISQSVVLRHGEDGPHLQAIALATDGTSMYYLVMGNNAMPSGGPPIWVHENEVKMSFVRV